ncbi:hypothetical protein N7471_009909 [Penicillium samsonianum]|nr:uncharacterized protein N7471_009909 [Penicillium samsonianum]KAJ6128692.1 hypothetical protein N7471_009909 [Penicillium samsonianum]
MSSPKRRIETDVMKMYERQSPYPFNLAAAFLNLF